MASGIKQKPHGTSLIKVTVTRLKIPGFARLEVRSGTDDPQLQQDLEAFVRNAVTHGDSDTILAIREGKSEALHKAYNRSKRGDAPVLTHQTGSLRSAFDTWLAKPPHSIKSKTKGKPLSSKTIKDWSDTINVMMDVGALPNAKVEQLPDILFAYQQHCIAKDQNFRFNNCATAVSNFIQSTDRRGKLSPLYLACTAMGRMHTDRKTHRDGTLSPKAVKKIMRRMTKAGNGHLAPHIWNLAALSCRAESEYAGGLLTYQPENHAVFIQGVKGTSADRFVPMVSGVGPVSNAIVMKNPKRLGKVRKGEQTIYTLNTLRKAFKEACDGKYLLEDLRSTGLTWWRMAGVDPICMNLYHAKSMKDIKLRYHTKGNLAIWSKWKRDIQRDHKRLERWLKKRLAPKAKPVETLPSLAHQFFTFGDATNQSE